MSARGAGVSQTLQAPGEFTTRAVAASGDCFYDCMDLLLDGEAPRSAELASPQAMRDMVARSFTAEIFSLFKTFADAGVEDFAWMNHRHLGINSLSELKAFASISGKEAGAGRCLWADEHAIQVRPTLRRPRVVQARSQPEGSALHRWSPRRPTWAC